MTQAIAVKEMVERAGHQVVSVVLGAGPNRQVPPFFASAMKMPIERIPTLDFTYQNNRKVDLSATLASIVRRIPDYWRGLQKLKAIVRETQPDVILNFFEALTGVYALTCRRRPPVIAIAHQFMCGHPDYVQAPGFRLQQLAMRMFVSLVGSSSTRLALSLYEAPDLPRKKIAVMPPLLRRQLFQLHSDPNGKFVLAYLLNHGYAEQIIEWHKRKPEIVLHCFYDKPDAPPEFQYDATLTFHRLDGEKFLRMMAQCRQVACTAGFESVCEAAYLGKPLFLVPVENHIEQQINSIDAVRIGLGITDRSFNLDRLTELPDALPAERFRAWVHRADAILLRAIELAVCPARESHFYRPWRTKESKA
jgi:uncharacterized protein (TIGR00661 family)